MLNFPFSSDITLNEGIYVDNATLDGERIDAYLKGSGDVSQVMNSAVVYAYGSSNKYGAQNFPILFQTQGMGNKKGYSTFDNQVKNYMLGKPKRTSVIAKTIYADSDKVGRNHTDIILLLKDRHFTKGEIIVKGTLTRNYQIQIQTGGERDGNGYKYIGKLFGASNSFIPAKLLRANEIWGDGPYKVSLEHSRGNENRTYTPYAITNTMSALRQSINVAGNAAKKKMNFNIQLDGQSFSLYYEWEKHLTNLQFMAVKEQDILMSKQTKDRLGYIHNYDVNSGKPIPSGNGIIGQIPKSNIMSYYKMTERKLGSWLTDVMSIAGTLSTGNNTTIDIMGGFDLLQSINDALTKSASMRPIIGSSELFVKKGENGLRYGSYFTEYEHISGVIFRFTHHNFFDESPLAQTAARNPFTGRSIMSSEGIIMNFGKVSYDTGAGGMKESSNIEYMFEEGREYVEGTVRGMASIEGKQGGEMATDIDASALHMMCTQGVHCYSPLSLGYMQFNLK